MIWNVYYAVLALFTGFFFATAIALAKASPNPLINIPAKTFIFVFRGSPLFIQFFLAYEAFVFLPKLGVDINVGFMTITAETRWLTKAWLAGLIVLFLNTSAYSAEIFHGAYNSVPKGDIEAADAYGMHGLKKFRRVVWPTMLRLAWPSYTNEAIFLYHATALIFVSSFPAWRQMGDAMYYARYFAQKTFNPFICYPIIAGYFIIGSLALIFLFGIINRRLNKHLGPQSQSRLKLRPQIMR